MTGGRIAEGDPGDLARVKQHDFCAYREGDHRCWTEPMRIFLAGATGAVGRVLTRVLVDAGHHVVGTSRSAQGVDRVTETGATGVRLDVFDPAAVCEAVAKAEPDVVIHQLTALSGFSLADNTRVRIEGTRNLVDAAKAANVSRIVAQSIAWAYRPGEAPADEITPLDLNGSEPRASTIRGVVALEGTVNELDDAVILRYGLLYGPGTFYARDGRIAKQLYAGKLPATNGISSFIHVDDAANAAALALEWPAGTVNIVDDEPAPGREWVPALAHALDAPAPAHEDGFAPWERGASNALARKTLRWEPRFPSWRTGFPEATRSEP
jgi:nucleoside-diphosphate-sugar epimerase